AFFSMKAIFVKLAYIYHVDAVTLLALRMLLCLPVLLISAWWSSRTHAHRMTGKDWLAVIFLGAVGYYLSPTIVAIISVFLFRKAIGRTGVIALVLSYVGIAVAALETVHTTGDMHAVIKGSVLIFLCTITYAIYISGSGQIVGWIGATRFAALATLVAAICVLIQFAIENPTDTLVTQPWQVYMHAGGMALVSTILPIFMTSKAIQMIGAAKVSMIGAVGPIATIFFGWLFLGEDVTVLQMIGAALVLAGVILVARKPAPKPTPSVASGEALAAAATGD